METTATFRIGHWTDATARTGCTTIVFDRLVPTVVDVRGGAPGTRETDLLDAERTVGAVDAILLTGGSAHGLSAAEGVMQFLRESDRGVETAAGRVPIVTAAVLYDLAVGAASWPTANNAYESCQSGSDFESASWGRIGAGVGATYRKAWPGVQPLDGGIGAATIAVPDLGSAFAIVVVNAIGDKTDLRADLLASRPRMDERTATSLMAIVLDGPADARTLRRCAVAAHDGLARSMYPAHTMWDGDLAYVSALQAEDRSTAPADAFRWAVATELAIESAIRSVTTS
jgi:L-aminopeptidase/D-esterase-like protein